MKLRKYQGFDVGRILDAFRSGVRAVLYVLATGGGKTVISSEVLDAYKQFHCCAIAHRQELISQISQALARNGIRHRVIAQPGVIREIISNHMTELGCSFYDSQAMCAVAGVDGLVKMQPDSWTRKVQLVFIDEAHHVLEGNKWGRAYELFNNALLLGVTATPKRADRKGLGRVADGFFDVLIEGPGMRDLIDSGYLTDYIIFAPESDMDFSDLKISKTTGEVSTKKLAEKFANSDKIVGDIVGSYLKHAAGKRGVTFVPDITSAERVAAAFNKSGVPAEVVHGKTPTKARQNAIKKLGSGELLQLVNVDLFGEGFDLPAIEVVSMARRTESYALYAQQFGRALRLMLDPWLHDVWEDFSIEERLWHIANSVKPHAIIIDHVSNVWRHNGPPDVSRIWTLERQDSKTRDRDPDDLPVRRCMSCALIFESWSKECPYCGYKPQPENRSDPKYVEGDLTELDPAILDHMRQLARDEMNKRVAIPYGANHMVESSVRKKHAETQAMRKALNEAIDYWAGLQFKKGLSVSDAYIKFYRVFGVDAILACTQSGHDLKLTMKSITEHIQKDKKR